MSQFTVRYLKIYIFTYIDEKPTTIFEEVISYFPNYKIGDEITFILSTDLDLTKDADVQNFQIKEIRSIICLDRSRKLPSEHTMYIRVENTSIESNRNEENQREIFNIDYLLNHMHPN